MKNTYLMLEENELHSWYTFQVQEECILVLKNTS